MHTTADSGRIYANIPLRELLASIEHDQWVYWSKAVAHEVSPERKQRWEKLWVPYEDLEDKDKEHDRVWADKVLALLTNG